MLSSGEFARLLITLANRLDLDQARRSRRAWSGSKLFDTLLLFMKEQLKKWCWNVSVNDKINRENLSSMQRVEHFCHAMSFWDLSLFGKVYLETCLSSYIESSGIESLNIGPSHHLHPYYSVRAAKIWRACADFTVWTYTISANYCELVHLT